MLGADYTTTAWLEILTVLRLTLLTARQNTETFKFYENCVRGFWSSRRV